MIVNIIVIIVFLLFIFSALQLVFIWHPVKTLTTDDIVSLFAEVNKQNIALCPMLPPSYSWNFTAASSPFIITQTAVVCILLCILSYVFPQSPTAMFIILVWSNYINNDENNILMVINNKNRNVSTEQPTRTSSHLKKSPNLVELG